MTVRHIAGVILLLLSVIVRVSSSQLKAAQGTASGPAACTRLLQGCIRVRPHRLTSLVYTTAQRRLSKLFTYKFSLALRKKQQQTT